MSGEPVDTRRRAPGDRSDLEPGHAAVRPPDEAFGPGEDLPRVLAGRTICLLSPMHLGTNPRLVKEAGALAAAGADVRVISLEHEDALIAHDRALAKDAPWAHGPVDVRRRVGRSGLRWLRGALRARSGGRPERRVARYTTVLAAHAASARADLVIAHTLGALPAAHRVARASGAFLGYDAEDLESAIGPATGVDGASLEAVEARFLPACDQITAASPGIARAYAERHRLPEPVVIRNVFSHAERGRYRPGAFRADRHPCALSLYWYSHTIGADRGLDDALAALSALPGDVHLHLRGRWAPGCEAALAATARSRGVADRVHHLEHVPPDELVARAAVHDVGLALETGLSENRRQCQTNKLFLYPLAGLALAATDVPGQRLALAEAPGAGFTYPPGEPAALAAALRRWCTHPAQLSSARAAARAAADSRWCWEREAPRLVALVARTLAGRAAAVPGAAR